MAGYRFLARINGIVTDTVAALVATANSLVAVGPSGTIDPSFLPAGIGADIVTIPASEALAAGDQVNIWNNSGAANARKADNATASAGKPCNGFVLAAVASGANAAVYRSGMNTQKTGLTPGADYYLGASGAVIAAAADAALAAGSTSQYIGKAVSATVLDEQPLGPIAVTS